MSKNTPPTLTSNQLATLLNCCFNEKLKLNAITQLKARIKNGSIDELIDTKFIITEKNGVKTVSIAKEGDINVKSLENILLEPEIADGLVCEYAKILRNPNSIENLRRLNQISTTDPSCLIKYISQNKIKEAQLLILLGHNVNHQMGDSKTALMIAAQKNLPDIVRLLIDYGADINTQSSTGTTALMQEAYHGNTDMIQCLIDLGANVNIQSHQGGGITALMSAVYNNKKAVQLLIDGGADMNMRLHTDGLTALMIAIRNNRYEIAELLIINNPTSIDDYDDNGFTPLMTAAQNGDTGAINFLITHGANINFQPTNGIPALIIAITNEQTTAIKLLINSGADVNLQSNDGGFTALMIAAHNGRKDIVQLLIDKGANVNLQSNDDGFTALMMAAQSGHKDIVQLLIDRGTNVNHKGCDENISALFLAITNDHFEVVKAILESGSDIDMKDNFDSYLTAFISHTKSGKGIAKLLSSYQRFADDIKPKIIEALQHNSKIKQETEPKFSIVSYGIQGLVVEISYDSTTQTNIKKQLTFAPVCDVDSVLVKSQLLTQKPKTPLKTEAPQKDELIRRIKTVKEKIKTEISEKDIISDAHTAHIDLVKKEILAICRANLQTPELPQEIKSFITDIGQYDIQGDNYPKGSIDFVRQSLGFLSAIKSSIKAQSLKTALQPKSEKEIDKSKQQDAVRTKFIGEFSPLVIGLLNVLYKDLVEESIEYNQIQDAKLLESKLDNLNSFSSLTSKKLAFLKPNSTIKPKTVNTLDALYVPTSENDNIKDLAQIFLHSNFKKYDDNQLQFIADIIPKIPEINLDRFLELSAINFTKSDNIIDSFLKTRLIINSLPENAREGFKQHLYQMCNYDNLEKVSEFLVVVEDLFYSQGDFEQGGIEQLIKNKQIAIAVETQSSSTSHVEALIKNPIKTLLQELQKTEKFSILLHTTTHGRQAQNPHIEKSKLQLLQENFATKTNELQEMLGMEVKQELLDKIITTIAGDFFNNIQKRAGGSHNIGFRIPKILPNKTSHLGEDEKAFYRQQLSNLTNALDIATTR